MITIDDGYLSKYEFTYPILKELDIQSHTYNQHYMISNDEHAGPVLTSQLFDEIIEGYKVRIHQDLTRDDSLIEDNVSNEVYALAYPYGAYS